MINEMLLELTAILASRGIDPDLAAQIVHQAYAQGVCDGRKPRSGAERTRSWRSRKSHDVTISSQNVTASTAPVRDENVTIRHALVVTKTSRGVTRRRPHELPADWQASTELVAYGMGLGLSAARVHDEMAQLKLWAKANAHRAVARKCDWHACAQGWLRRAASYPRRDMSPRGFAAVLDDLMALQHFESGDERRD